MLFKAHVLVGIIENVYLWTYLPLKNGAENFTISTAGCAALIAGVKPLSIYFLHHNILY